MTFILLVYIYTETSINNGFLILILNLKQPFHISNSKGPITRSNL